MQSLTVVPKCSWNVGFPVISWCWSNEKDLLHIQRVTHDPFFFLDFLSSPKTELAGKPACFVTFPNTNTSFQKYWLQRDTSHNDTAMIQYDVCVKGHLKVTMYSYKVGTAYSLREFQFTMVSLPSSAILCSVVMAGERSKSSGLFWLCIQPI